jgi:hypothetical protein
MWFIEANLEKVKAGSRALARRLPDAGRALDRIVNPEPGDKQSFGDEILRQIIRRVVLVMIEIGIGALFRRFTVRRTPARVYPFPTVQPAS